jgi:hypothetical protein
MNLEQAFREAPDDTSNRRIFRLLCKAYDWNGRKMVRAYYTLQIESFKGRKEITSLEFYPAKFFYKGSEGKSARESPVERLLMRGKIFQSLCEVKPGASQQLPIDEGSQKAKGLKM